MRQIIPKTKILPNLARVIKLPHRLRKEVFKSQFPSFPFQPMRNRPFPSYLDRPYAMIYNNIKNLEIKFRNGGKLLDLGYQTGLSTRTLASKLGLTPWGIDSNFLTGAVIGKEEIKEVPPKLLLEGTPLGFGNNKTLWVINLWGVINRIQGEIIKVLPHLKDNSFEMVSACRVIGIMARDRGEQFFTNPVKSDWLMGEIKRILKPAGYLAIWDYVADLKRVDALNLDEIVLGSGLRMVKTDFLQAIEEEPDPALMIIAKKSKLKRQGSLIVE